MSQDRSTEPSRRNSSTVGREPLAGLVEDLEISLGLELPTEAEWLRRATSVVWRNADRTWVVNARGDVWEITNRLRRTSPPASNDLRLPVPAPLRFPLVPARPSAPLPRERFHQGGPPTPGPVPPFGARRSAERDAGEISGHPLLALRELGPKARPVCRDCCPDDSTRTCQRAFCDHACHEPPEADDCLDRVCSFVWEQGGQRWAAGPRGDTLEILARPSVGPSVGVSDLALPHPVAGPSFRTPATTSPLEVSHAA